MTRVSVSRHASTNALFEKLLGLSPHEQRRLAAKLGAEGLDLSLLPIPRFRGNLASYPLSSGQLGVWVEERLDPGSPAWNMPAAVRLRGAMDVAALDASLALVVRRHDALRMRFFEQDGRPRQAPASSPIELELIDEAPDEERARELLVRILRRPFDLTRGPPMRAALVRLGADDHVFMIVVHHIVSDAWSLNTVLTEVARAFVQLRAGVAVDEAPAELDYADFAAWETCRAHCPRLERDLQLRAKALAGAPRLALSARAERPERNSSTGTTLSRRLSPALLAAIQSFACSRRVTPAVFWMAVLQAVLHFQFRQDRFLVGMSTSIRTRRELEGLVGYLVNLSLIRADLSEAPTFVELVDRVQREFFAVHSSLHLPFSRVVAALEPRRVSGATPLASAVLVVQNHPEREVRVEGLEISSFPLDPKTTRFDLTLIVSGGDAPELSVQYATDVLEAARAKALVERCVAFAEGAVQAPERPISRLGGSIVGKARISMTAPTAISTCSRSLVRTEPFERGSGPIDLRPVILSPTRADFVPHHWLSANREFLEAELLSRGAVVLRGFGASTVSRFEALVAAMGARLSTDNGELPRLRLGDHAFTAVDYPASERIHWHNENAFYRRWPGNIWFGCLQAARSGGATPIVDGRSMLETLPAWIVERLSRVRLVYVRNYRHGLGLPWSEVFAANTRCEVESKCAALGVECEWLDDGLRTRSVRPAVVRHPRTGELVWFNQITHWHPCCLPPELRRTLESHYRPEDMPRSVHFEDGSPIPERMVEQICAAYRALEVASPWRVGDMLVIDNMLVSHARESFEGPRKLAIAMGNMVHEDQLVAPASTANGGRG